MSLRKVATSTARDFEEHSRNSTRLNPVRRRHQHNPELRSHRIRLGKDAHDLIGGGVRRHVVIFRFAPKQEIAHASAHQIGLKAALAQGLHDRGGEIFQHARSAALTTPIP